MKRFLPAICTGLVVVAAVVLACFRVADSDLFWHLRNGYEMLSSGRIASHDVYSYTAKGSFYAYYSWLWEIAAALLHRAGGFELLVLVKALWTGLLFALLALAGWTRGARGLSLAWALLFGLLLVRFRLYTRPEMVTLLLVVLFDLLATAYLDTGRKRLLATLPFLACLWSNLHPYVIVGPALLATHWAGELVGRRLGLGASERPGRPALLGLTALACSLATLLNPYGWRIFTPALKLVLSDSIASTPTREWLPPRPDDFLLFFLLGGAATLLVLSGVRRARLQEMALFFGSLGLALLSLRNIGLFAMLATPILAARLTVLAGATGPALRRRLPALSRIAGPALRASALVAAVAVVMLKLVSPQASLLHMDKSRYYRMGLGLAPSSAPVDAVEFVEAQRLEGPLFNSWAVGGWLIWRSWPRLEVFVDGRQMIFERLLARIQSTPPDRLIREMGFKSAVVSYDEPRFLAAFDASPDHALVFFDDVAAVYVHRDLLRPGLEPLRHLNPGDLTLRWSGGAAEDGLRAMVAEARRAATQSPRSARAAMLSGALARRTGDLEASVEAYRRAIALDPPRALYRNNLGQTLMELGRPAAALEQFLRAAALEPGSFAAAYNRGLALAGLGRQRASRRAFRHARDLAPDRPEPHLSLARLETDPGRARGHLRRALELAGETALAAEIRTELARLETASP